jgi:GDP-L-fucose synthase
VTIIDNYVEGGGGILPSAGWPLFDPRDHVGFRSMRGDCRYFFANSSSPDSFDLVLHLAAVVGGRQTIEDMPLSVADDLSIDAAMWQWAARTRPGRVVYFSSSAAYPIDLQREQENYALHENDLMFDRSYIGLPDLSYGWAKMTGEYLGKLASERAGVSYIVYRPFSGYAEDQSVGYPMTDICKRALRHILFSERMSVWGSGLQVRDWIHMSDVVRMVSQTCLSAGSGTTLNLCTGVGHNMIQIASMACEAVKDIVGLAQGGLTIETMTDKPVGVMYRVGDPASIQEFTGAAHVALSDGIRRVVEHHFELLHRI